MREHAHATGRTLSGVQMTANAGIVTLAALAAVAVPVCTPATPVADWLPYASAAAEPTLTAAPTRWPLPIVVTGTPLALTERAAFRATYSAWWTQTPAAPWPWPTAAASGTVGATATISPAIDATIPPTVGGPAQVPMTTGTPALFPCRFTSARCGTRAFIAYAGRGRRR